MSMACLCNCHATCEPVRKYRLLSGHVSALRKLLLAVRHYGRNRVHIYDEMKRCEGAPFQLTDAEWTNFSHLRMHGLAHHADRENPKSGRWLVTRNGAAFLKGELAIAKTVLVRRGKVVGHEGDFVTIRAFARQRPEFDQIPYINIEHPEKEVEVEARTPAML